MRTSMMSAVWTATARQLYFFGMALFSGLALAGFLIMGPAIETMWSPVLRDVRLYDAKLMADESIEFRAIYNKVRNCVPLDINWYQQNEGAFEGVHVEWVNPPRAIPQGQIINRPLGLQISDWWRVPEAGTYFAVIHYDCQPFWTTEVRYGPFDLPSSEIRGELSWKSSRLSSLVGGGRHRPSSPRLSYSPVGRLP